MNPLESELIHCPYCGEGFEIDIDCSLNRQEYIEDCAICCRPITLLVTCSEYGVNVVVRRDDEC